MSKKNRTFPYIAAMTAATLAVPSVAPAVMADSFTDIKDSAYITAIEGLKTKGIIDGYGNKTFQPKRELTRSDVVKMLGKYLVALGYEIPSDYKTYMRFKDLTPKSNDELLQYAALVYDHGVFIGNQNRLLAEQKLSMQHMAVVLVRALSTIDNFDYVSYVQEQRFLLEYYDLEQATEEAQKAIQVVDYYDFYKANESEAHFEPHATAVREQFAHFLYNLLNIESPARNNPEAIVLEGVTIVSPTRLTVKLSNGTTHNIVLEEPLEENVPTPVTLRINGRPYYDVVTYKPVQLEVTDTEFINSGQFVLHFNQPVTLKEVYRGNDLSRILRLKASSGTRTYELTKGELSEDKLSFKVTLGENIPVNTRYTIELLNIHPETGAGLVDETESVYYAAHSTTPQVERVEKIDNYQVRVHFTEPLSIYYPTSSMTYKLADGTAVTGVTAKFEENKRYSSWTQYAYYATYVTLDLRNAFASGRGNVKDLPIYVHFNQLADIANNAASVVEQVTGRTTVVKDGVKPTLQSVEQLGAKQMQLQFSEPLEQLGYYDLSFASDKQSYYIETMERMDEQTYILTMDDYLDGYVQIETNPGRTIADLSGETNTVSKRVKFVYDNLPANIIRTEVVRDDNKEYLFLTFDRNVVAGDQAQALLQNVDYIQNNTHYQFDTTDATFVYQHNARQLKIPLRELLRHEDTVDTSYRGELVLADIYNEYKEPVATQNVEFERGRDYNYNTEQLQLVSVETSRTNPSIVGSKRILLNFNFNVDIEKATKLTNYKLHGYTIESAAVHASNLKQVELTIKETISAPVSPYLSVWNITAANSSSMLEDYYERVPLNESVVPYIVSSSKNTQAQQIVLTYSEAMETVDPNMFIVQTSNGELVAHTASNDPKDPAKIILTFDTTMAQYGSYKVSLRPSRVLTDLYSNPVNFKQLTVY